MTWKITNPDVVGLYIASTSRKAGWVRCWTGKHWTAPTAVHDVDLPGRMPDVTWGPAEKLGSRDKIEWLEPFVRDEEGFIAWGGHVPEGPLPESLNVVARLRDVPGITPMFTVRSMGWTHGGYASDIVAYKVVFPDESAPSIAPSVPAPTPAVFADAPEAANQAGGIGDLASNAKGTGARFNAGKPDVSLIPLRVIARGYMHRAPASPAVEALDALGKFQETHEVAYLYDALMALGLEEGWKECAQVFSFGRGKYAAWNWAKGMPWSVPLACAARHAMDMVEGHVYDKESKLELRGHVFCNVVMLLSFQALFPEGNDLPTQWLTTRAA